MLSLLTPSVMDTEAVSHLRDDFRRAFQNYMKEGDRMAALLRAGGDDISPDGRIALRDQQTALTAALREYETARRKYVEGVMGQLAGLSAMSLDAN